MAVSANGPVLGYRLRLAIGQALDGARRDRDRCAVAAAMSETAGYPISKTMLDRWAAPSNEQHRLPAELTPALVLVTGDHRPLALLVEACGCRLADPLDVRAAEIGRAYAAKLAADERLREALDDRTGGAS